MNRAPGMVDVAREAGVSHVTVSRVLNDHPFRSRAVRAAPHPARRADRGAAGRILGQPGRLAGRHHQGSRRDMDGAGELRIFGRIVLPMMVQGLVNVSCCSSSASGTTSCCPSSCCRTRTSTRSPSACTRSWARARETATCTHWSSWARPCPSSRWSSSSWSCNASGAPTCWPAG
ncbi:LacI family DNA-binding transcriptional regulator [Nonomuraea sp. NPDC050691]|uniref:LacI family DNA-binding transcriptional regulator n=1 Tax=Nonomuraea sp. NPDC050691 TaxID=3155661 RepID=UPI0033F0F507